MLRRVAIYARVSTANGQSVEMQLRDLHEFVAHRGFELVRDYCDEGVSGSLESRPALNALLADARRRKFDAVLVWKLDRWAEAWPIWSACSTNYARWVWS